MIACFKVFETSLNVEYSFTILICNWRMSSMHNHLRNHVAIGNSWKHVFVDDNFFSTYATYVYIHIWWKWQKWDTSIPLIAVWRHSLLTSLVGEYGGRNISKCEILPIAIDKRENHPLGIENWRNCIKLVLSISLFVRSASEKQCIRYNKWRFSLFSHCKTLRTQSPCYPPFLQLSIMKYT